MTRVNTSKLREDLSDTLNKVAFKGERVVLSRNGKDVAAIISIEDFKLLEDLEDRIDLSLARKALDEAARGETENWEKVKKDLGMK
jgi:prevent-host-death family protein